MTILSSFGGGCYALAHSLVRHKGKVDPSDLINGILGSLVGITGNVIHFISAQLRMLIILQFPIFQPVAFYFALGNQFLWVLLDQF